jgi:hypothetical protein
MVCVNSQTTQDRSLAIAVAVVLPSYIPSKITTITSGSLCWL